MILVLLGHTCSFINILHTVTMQVYVFLSFYANDLIFHLPGSNHRRSLCISLVRMKFYSNNFLHITATFLKILPSCCFLDRKNLKLLMSEKPLSPFNNRIHLNSNLSATRYYIAWTTVENKLIYITNHSIKHFSKLISETILLFTRWFNY